MAAGLHGDEGSGGLPHGSARPAAAGRKVSLIAPDTGAAQRLIDRGMALRLRAPELAMVFGERAAALAEAAGSEQLWAQAEGLAVVGRVRLGQRAGVVDRAVATLRTAEAEGQTQLAAAMRVELALCARSVGVPLTGLAALRPVLGDPDIAAGTRAVAMLQFVGCMVPLGRRRVLDRALAEADELVTSDTGLSEADRTLLRALICSRAAACQRRYGDLAMALERAREGLDLLDGLAPDAADGVQLRARLVLELVCALLDRGEDARAAELAEPLLAAPARAPAAGPLAWLRLAVATRIHLPAGAAEAAGSLVRDALYSAQRHELLTVTARLWLELAHIEERVGRAAEAVRCMREARMSEHAHGRMRRQAIGLLIGEFGRGEQHIVDVPRAISEPLRSQQPVLPPRSETLSAETVHAPTPELTEPAKPELEQRPELRLTGPTETTAEQLKKTEAPEVAAEPVLEDRAGQRADAQPRHRAGGAVDARSVLERLGVNVGSGGRRRAHGGPPAESDRGPEVVSAAPEPEVRRADEPTVNDEPSVEQEPAAKAEPESPAEELPEAPAEERPTVSTSDKPEVSEPRKLDSVLAVFSNWTDDDAGVVAPRTRRRRHERPPGEAVAANGRPRLAPEPRHGAADRLTSPAREARNINGDDSIGRHRGEG